MLCSLQTPSESLPYVHDELVTRPYEPKWWVLWSAVVAAIWGNTPTPDNILTLRVCAVSKAVCCSFCVMSAALGLETTPDSGTLGRLSSALVAAGVAGVCAQPLGHSQVWTKMYPNR